MKRKFVTTFTTLILSLSMFLFVGCAGVDLSKVDSTQTTQIAKIGQQIISQLDPATLAKLISDVQTQIDKNKPPVVVNPPVNPPVTPPVVPPIVTLPVTGAIPLPEVKDNHIFIVDFDKIPDLMRAAGYGPARDTVLWYVLFSCYGSHIWPGNDFKDDPDAVTITRLDGLRDEIYKWYADYINRVGLFLKANPTVKATILLNDGNDKGGCFIGDVIKGQLDNMGVTNPVDMGTIYVYK